MSNFPPLLVVDRGGETQLQMIENLNKFTLDKGLPVNIIILNNYHIKNYY